MEEKYSFGYSGEKFEGSKSFSNMKDLRKFLQTIPPYELKNSVVMKNKKGIMWVGQYVLGKTGLRVRF